MKRVEVAPGVEVNVADDATDEEIEALKAQSAPRPLAKDRRIEEESGDVKKKSEDAPAKRAK
jgi:hypothetical protein